MALNRALKELMDKGEIVKPVVRKAGQTQYIYSRSAVDLREPALVTLVRAKNVMADAGLLTIRKRGENVSRIRKHLIHRLLLDAIYDYLNVLESCLEAGSSRKAFHDIKCGLPDYGLSGAFVLLQNFRVMSKDDFDRVFGDTKKSILDESSNEIRTLVGLMKSIKPSYRVRPMYFEKAAKRKNADEGI